MNTPLNDKELAWKLHEKVMLFLDQTKDTAIDSLELPIDFPIKKRTINALRLGKLEVSRRRTNKLCDYMRIATPKHYF